MKEWVVEQITSALPLLFASFLAAIGGAVHYLNKIDRQGVPFKVAHFALEIFTSAFVGIVAFLLCDYAGWDWQFTAAIVAISGHMGARALFLAEKAIVVPVLKRYGYVFGKGEIDGETQEHQETSRSQKNKR